MPRAKNRLGSGIMNIISLVMTTAQLRSCVLVSRHLHVLTSLTHVPAPLYETESSGIWIFFLFSLPLTFFPFSLPSALSSSSFLLFSPLSFFSWPPPDWLLYIFSLNHYLLPSYFNFSLNDNLPVSLSVSLSRCPLFPFLPSFLFLYRDASVGLF